MKILVIGSGAREHVILSKLSVLVPTSKRESQKNIELFCAPGNAGTSLISSNIPINVQSIEDVKKIRDFALQKKIDLTIVGPELPLSLGIVDEFNSFDLKIFGPDKATSNLESNKTLAKHLMKEFEIPTPNYKVFNNKEQAISYVLELKNPFVIKANGLAAGKGVFVNPKNPKKVILDIMEKKIFKNAGNSILVEDMISGEELSLMIFLDGKSYQPMVLAKDFKKISRTSNINTGGMGSIAPISISKKLYKKIQNQIVSPTIKMLIHNNYFYKGVLYIGLIIHNNNPYVLEYNVRFGDPETSSILPLLKNDFVDLILSCINGTLSEIDLEWDDKICLTKVLTSRGYPEKYEINKEVSGLDKEFKSSVFHAGTINFQDKVVTNGGRVLNITTKQKSLKLARKVIHNDIKKVNFEGMFFRKDI